MTKKEKLQLAHDILDKAEELGCAASLHGEWVKFEPVLPYSMLIDCAKVGDELAEILAADTDA